VLKFSILLFITDVLLVHSSSGQLRCCPGLGPPLMPRRNHPLKLPEKRMLKMPTSPEWSRKRQGKQGPGKEWGARHGVFSGKAPKQMQTLGEFCEWVSTSTSFLIQTTRKRTHLTNGHQLTASPLTTNAGDATLTSATRLLPGEQPGAPASACLKPAQSISRTTSPQNTKCSLEGVRK